jgi:hypothetical protein
LSRFWGASPCRDLPTGKAGRTGCSGALIYSQFDGAGSINEDVMKQQISGKQAARVAVSNGFPSEQYEKFSSGLSTVKRNFPRLAGFSTISV